jgi:hypothetical protein
MLPSWVVLLLLLSSVIAQPSQPEIAQSASTDKTSSDLTSSLIIGRIHQPELYSHAITIIESLISEHPCHRLASSALIGSCQSLEKATSTEVSLYETREEYATKLAMCELNAVKAQISSHCADFIPSSQACRKGRSTGFFRRPQAVDGIPGKLCYPEVTRHQVTSCISALQSKPQWWTSYSNALQNVFVVCQASRSAIEKGKLFPRKILMLAFVHTSLVEFFAARIIFESGIVSSV